MINSDSNLEPNAELDELDSILESPCALNSQDSDNSDFKSKSKNSFDDLWILEPPEIKPAIFNTANEQAYPVYPCISSLVGKSRSGKTIYLSYAMKRWANYEEAFGLVPTGEIRAVCIAHNKVDGIDCINPAKQGKFMHMANLTELIRDVCVYRFVNVIFIDNFRLLFSRTNIRISDQEFYDILSDLSFKHGVYIIVSHSSKSNSMDDSFFGVTYITKTDSHIDLVFDWRTKEIKRQVFFGNEKDELIPESETALSDRLEEEQFEKYGGYEQLQRLLSYFKEGKAQVSNISKLMSLPRTTTYRLISKAKEDGYLSQDGARSSYSLSYKGNEIIERKERFTDLIKPSDYELYARFRKETFDKKAASIETKIANIEKMILAGSPSILIGKSELSEWEAWKVKNSVNSTVELTEQAEQAEQPELAEQAEQTEQENKDVS